ncbi:prefoldin subunit 2-like [Mytilus galloprovincialis]|uniref:prefoldin subunit 2-like n=1 Tax=Mytilus edulis TaxID=6550 RepID=UPI0039EFDE66
MAAKGKGKTQEQIVAGFQELRQQQRAVAGKISELNGDLKEHEIVIDTLKETESSRKCFRMVGGVLVEHTVEGVLPALTNHKEQLNKMVETLTKQLETKGIEINKYREEYNLQIKGEDSRGQDKQEKDVKTTGGVLVA